LRKQLSPANLQTFHLQTCRLQLGTSTHHSQKESAMQLTTYTDPAGFLAVTETILEREGAAYALMLSIVLRVRQYPERIGDPPYMATVTAGDRLLAAAVMTPPYPVIVATLDPAGQDALPLFVEDLRDNGWSVSGVNGPSDASSAFAALWNGRTDQPMTLAVHLRSYELRRVMPPDPVPGRLRLAEPADLSLVARWARDFQLEALPHEDASGALHVAETGIADRHIYLWEDGEPVTMVAKARPTVHGVTVNLVYTPPSQRRRGYATNAVAHLSQILLDEGYDYCTLFTDMANPTSNSIYQKIGYRPVVDYMQYKIGTGD
jgi:predicted GNAT family acetyltransferase